jgi:polyisoprenoid-binding protein YceI
MSDTLTRTAADTTVPVVGTYELDPSHSSADFQVKHLGLSKVRGGFEVRSGTVVIAEDPTQSRVEAVLDAASFSTGAADRDAHVKSADFLDVETYPELVFRSTGVRQDGGDWKVDGELTIRDVTQPITLDVAFEGAGADPWGNSRIAFSAEAELDRERWGITWNQALETGGVLVGKKVKITIDAQAVAQG